MACDGQKKETGAMDTSLTEEKSAQHLAGRCAQSRGTHRAGTLEEEINGAHGSGAEVGVVGRRGGMIQRSGLHLQKGRQLDRTGVKPPGGLDPWICGLADRDLVQRAERDL
jgi:hypothetical protein